MRRSAYYAVYHAVVLHLPRPAARYARLSGSRAGRTPLQCFDKPGKIGDRYPEGAGAGLTLPDAEYRHAGFRVPAEAHGT